MISARELIEKEKARANVRKETYRALLEQFCRKIRTASDLGNKGASLTVPPFVIGFPAYDMAVTVTYMTRQLERLGYRVERVGLADLRVSWGRAPPGLPDQEPPDAGDTWMPTLVGLQKTANRLRRKP
jgi:hypothetical protein